MTACTDALSHNVKQQSDIDRPMEILIFGGYTIAAVYIVIKTYKIILEFVCGMYQLQLRDGVL